MIRLLDSSRREFLRFAGWGALSAAASAFSALVTQASEQRNSTLPGFGKAKSVIFVYTSGGQSQLETWDPKPEAPSGIRGEFGAIQTSLPGCYLSEHMPAISQWIDQGTLVRSVTHDDFDHGSATYLALTGRPHPRRSSNPPIRPTDAPTIGALVHRMRPSRSFPQTAVHLNGPAQVPILVAPGQFGGLLGPEYDPLLVGDPTTAGSVMPCLDRVEDLPAARVLRRRQLLTSLESEDQAWAKATFARKDHLYDQAFDILNSSKVRRVFDLESEPLSIRERYGTHRSGQACLLARKLVEAQVPWVTVIWNHTNRGQDQDPKDPGLYGWDTHNDIFHALKSYLLPRFDQSFTALLEDLKQRGLLETTLVVCMGEFGRAPKVAYEPGFAGRSPGRKHWASVYSAFLAGAGIRSGHVYGASDRIAGYPQTDPVSPGDIAATMVSALGIPHDSHYQTPQGQPVLLTTGKPITGLYG